MTLLAWLWFLWLGIPIPCAGFLQFPSPLLMLRCNFDCAIASWL